MKKLFLMLGVVALLASCTSKSNTITIEGVDSTNVVVDSVLQSLDSINVIIVEQDSVI